jgi:hypothetical protein
MTRAKYVIKILLKAGKEEKPFLTFANTNTASNGLPLY